MAKKNRATQVERRNISKPPISTNTKPLIASTKPAPPFRQPIRPKLSLSTAGAPVCRPTLSGYSFNQNALIDDKVAAKSPQKDDRTKPSRSPSPANFRQRAAVFPAMTGQPAATRCVHRSPHPARSRSTSARQTAWSPGKLLSGRSRHRKCAFR